MTALTILLAGVVLGWLAARIASRPRSPEAPPATVRQIRRAAHDRLADLSTVREAVPLSEPRPVSVRLVPIYIKAQGPTPPAPEPLDDFDLNSETW